MQKFSASQKSIKLYNNSRILIRFVSFLTLLINSNNIEINYLNFNENFGITWLSINFSIYLGLWTCIEGVHWPFLSKSAKEKIDSTTYLNDLIRELVTATLTIGDHKGGHLGGGTNEF